MKCFILRICQPLLSLSQAISAQMRNYAVPYSLYVTAELEANLELFHSLPFLLTAIKSADTCELLLASHHHLGSHPHAIHTSVQIIICFDNHLPTIHSLAVNILLSAMGLTVGVPTRLCS